MASFFDNLFGDQDPEDYEEDYINQVVPDEARELWDASVENSPVWDQYSAEDHMYLADIFADAVYSGDFDAAEDYLEYLEIDWDDYDIHSFYEAYEQAKG